MMRHACRDRAHRLIPLLPIFALAGCYDPPVNESVLLSIEQDGRVTLTAETTFKPWNDLDSAGKEAIQRIVDLYELGRDPWLRGLERAGAADIAHECRGEPGSPRGITRSGVLPSMEAIVTAMPDAIANFRLVHDDDDGTITLRIIHIDIPEKLRENRRRVGAEIRSFAHAGYRFSEAHCDLYDYLAEHAERRRDVLQALQDDEHIAGLLSPGETVLIRRVNERLLKVMEFGQQEPPPVAASMAFAPFEHGFCLRLPPGAEMVAAGGFLENGKEDARPLWCAPRLTLEDLVDDLFPRADPELLDEKILDDPARLADAPFTCVRHAGEVELESAIWERILPKSRYELIWKTTPEAP